ncbi:23S rRNA (uracil(1939)-C(5))-methyltransferase RlmD [Thermoanaerobacterium sp. RBIITD]|uniref:23S rRNA (uracil(1939)-C(5))-methyltransferase RlmD n=1 Tax=Thermoanaerobacterium sp. RBIITD TaxID=1550240 RepID=UPI000BB995CD|nr:23S rRNA (uracil(1939)-C(5))-methyltransferase RlmD [Thermoanaerobacterium sp. RBIITD]SNX54835.1 23S rRNA (uracil1939-C5)-methyltransferase [Thermoanaerobacterium sp. RBIITD]
MQNIEVGDRYEIYIDNMAHEGQGVGRLNGIAVFVDGALIGEKVVARIDEAHKNYLNAHVVKIIVASLERINPQCPYSDRCGGCMLQHLNYEGQLMFKKQIVRDNLSRIGKINVEISDTIGMKNPKNYRNKAQYPVGVNNGEVVTGFYTAKTHDIVPIDTCMLQNETSIKITKIIRDWMKDFKITAYGDKTGKGLLRHIVTKVGFKTGEVMAVLVINGDDIPHKDELINSLKENISGLKSIVLNINKRRLKVVMGKENITIFGDDFITDYIGDIKFEISPLSFFQVNPVQTKVLYNKALDYADLKGNETVIDVYCGIGTISLFFAKSAKHVYGIEIVEEAIKDAKRNAEINNIKNTEFIAGKAEVVMPKLYKRGIRPDVIVVDPPRRGCDNAVLEACTKMKPEKIIYVSCNPSTLARDLRYLEDNGFKTEKVQPVDMFPFTSHIECVVLLKRKHS